MMTLSAPSRHEVRATSIAVLPPPTTTTVPLSGVGLLRLLAEEIDALDDALGVELALDLHRVARPCAGAEEHGVVLLHELVERDVLADADVVPDLAAGAADVLDLAVDHVVGQAVDGDAVAEHAAGSWHAPRR